MSKNIKISIMANANLAAMRDTSREAAKMAEAVDRANDQMRQATLRSSAEFNSIAAEADRAAKAMGEGYKTLNDFLKDLAPKEDAAANAAKGLSAAGNAATKSMTGLGRAAQILSKIFEGFGGPIGFITKNLLLGTIWTAAGKAVQIFSNKVAAAKENAEKLKETRLSEELKMVQKNASTISDAFDKGTSAIDRQIKSSQNLLAVQDKLIKATLELQKQRELSAASGNSGAQEIIERKYAIMTVENDSAKEEKRLNAELAAAIDNEAAGNKWLDDMNVWFSDVDKRIAEYRSKVANIEEHAKMAARHRSVNNVNEYLTQSGESKDYERYKKQIKELSAARAKGEENVAKMRTNMSGYGETIKRTEKELAALKILREARQIEDERYVSEKADAIARAEDKEVQKEKEKADAIAKAEEDAEKKAAEKAAAERARLDAQEAARRERERQAELAAKIKDHQKLLAAERAEESKTRSAVSAAESKLQRAWGWYRDKDSMAAQLAEEKADAQARKQFEKDFDRLRGRRDWRTAENLSVDDEAVRRVALAREEKEAAERHLAEIEKNTANLATKLDELLQVKG